MQATIHRIAEAPPADAFAAARFATDAAPQAHMFPFVGPVDNPPPLLVLSPVGGLAGRLQHVLQVPDISLEQRERHGDADGLIVGARERERYEPLARIVDQRSDLQVLGARWRDHDLFHGDSLVVERSVSETDAVTSSIPASRQIGDTVARWRARDAEPAILDLAPYQMAAETYAPAGFFNMLCAMTAAGMALLLAVYIAAAYLRGGF